MRGLSIVLVAAPGAARRAYEQELDRIGVTWLSLDSPREIPALLEDREVSGILFDVATLVRAGVAEKRIANELMTLLPWTRVRWDAGRGEVRLLPNHGTPEAGASLAGFIEHECRPFGSRRVRQEPRHEVVVPVLLCTGSVFDESAARRSVTVNISRHGCFVYTVDEWTVGSKIALVCPEIDREKVIVGEVRWCVPWGTGSHWPGIGIRFESIDAALVTRLLAASQ